MEIWDVKLSARSKRDLSRMRYCYGTVADAIEGGRWHIPIETYEYRDVKRALNEAFRDFYHIPDILKVSVSDYSANIISYHKGH